MSGTGRERRASDGRAPDHAARARLEHAVRLCRASLYIGDVWPRLWLPLGVAGVFVVLSWLGFWSLLPAAGRMAGTLLFAAAFIAACVPAIARRYPSRQEALRALDAGAGSARLPDPASLIDDTQALGLDDPASRALWALHRRRAELAVENLRAPAPRPETASYDYYGLRGALVVALVAAAFIAGGERGRRLSLAFDWRAAQPADQVAQRVDGWIDPPAYTRLPPVMLDLAKAGARDVSVPVGSVLVLRFAGQDGEHLAGDVETEGGLNPVQAAQSGDGIAERRYEVAGMARVSVAAAGDRATLAIAAIPDDPPAIDFVDKPEATRRGGLTIVYRAGDDYGVTQAQGIVTLPGDGAEQALVPAPVIALPLPRGGEEPQELRTTADLAAHPWAGADVRLTLVARDAAGQEGRSETISLTLPQRAFINPVARALVEQRRNLVFRPHDWRDVRMALRALRIAPELFTPEASVYLGLVTAEKLLSNARDQQDLVDAAEFLWNMAVVIEDGDASDTEKALRAAQQALQEAIDRNAPPEEIARLAQELREALNRHLSEMARNQSRNRDQNAQNSGQPSRTITPEELAAMIDRMERLAREGDVAGAQQLMEQLRDILDNMQMAQGNEGGSQAGEAGRAMRSLDGMIRNQQRLRDDTFRQNNELAEGGDPQQGGEQPGQGSGQRSGQESGQGSGQGAGQGSAGGSGSLAGRQQALRRQLERLQQGLADQGLAGEPGFDAAERAMRDAEERLGEGDGDGAVDAQGRALQALLNGAQGLAQQMQQAQQGENGEPGDQNAQEPGSRDPLGRTTGNRRWSDGDTRVPGADESAVVRARRILEELRRRLGDPTRPNEERDYLERLLRRD